MYKDISVEELKEMIKKTKNLELIDVREPSEYMTGNINGSKLIPLGVLNSKLSAIRKDLPIVFICRSGNRSAYACRIAEQNGFSNIHNLSGGMLEWNSN